MIACARGFGYGASGRRRGYCARDVDAKYPRCGPVLCRSARVRSEQGGMALAMLYGPSRHPHGSGRARATLIRKPVPRPLPKGAAITALQGTRICLYSAYRSSRRGILQCRDTLPNARFYR